MKKYTDQQLAPFAPGHAGREILDNQELVAFLTPGQSFLLHDEQVIFRGFSLIYRDWQKNEHMFDSTIYPTWQEALAAPVIKDAKRAYDYQMVYYSAAKGVLRDVMIHPQSDVLAVLTLAPVE